MYGQNDSDRLNAVREFVGQARRSGQITQQQADAFFAVAGNGANGVAAAPAPVERTVNIALRVTGDLPLGDRTNFAVEEALGGVARQAPGVNLVRGSVRVS